MDSNHGLDGRTRRHRSEYPQGLQEVGDILDLWDADGYLIECPFPTEGMDSVPLLTAVILNMTKPGR